MNPALIAPFCSVCIASDGSIGDTVRPMIRHWTKCTTISSVSKMRAPARHRLVRDFLISLGLSGEFARTGSGILRASFVCWLTQLLFIYCYHFRTVQVSWKG